MVKELRNTMNTIDDSDLFQEKGYYLDALILTSFTEIDVSRIKRYLRKSNSLLKFDFNRMWLFQCNPIMPGKTDNLYQPEKTEKQDKVNSIFLKSVFSRVFMPCCKKNGKQIVCKECLEKCVEEKGIPEKVFHPKVWLLRFVKEDKPCDYLWKLVVSSKNMSREAEKLIDCYFVTKGRRNENNSEQNSDLIKLLEDLKSDREEYKSLVEEIKKLRWEQSPDFFYVNGEDWQSLKHRLPWSKKKIEDMRVLSPFLNKQFVIYLFNDVCKETKIYSTKEGFSSLDSSCIPFLKNMFVQKFEVDNKVRPWHAKIFIWKTDGKWYMLLGSLNATVKAFSDNTEFGVWFEIEENQIPDWKGDTPELPVNSLEKDDESDRKIEGTFKGKEYEQLSSLDQQILREALREEMINEATDEIIKSALESSEETGKYDLESIIYCEKYSGDLNSLSDKIKEINTKYYELSKDRVWEAYFKGCVSLIDTVKEMKDATN